MRLLLGYGSCGIAAGADEVLQVFEAAFKDKGLDIIKVGCNGLCFAEPLLQIIDKDGNDHYFGKINPDDAKEIASSLLEGKIPNQNLLSGEDIDFLTKQTRIALRNCGLINPESLDEYRDRGGYEAFEKYIKFDPKDILEEIKISGLRGRGGAGFPAWRKWEATALEKADNKYIICNADEGDPGAFMDRSLLEGDPHSVLEGMMIAGLAVGANHGLIYARAEYPLAISRLKTAMADLKKAGLTGKNILGSNFSFDFKLIQGAGAFVCGEETALLASLEGERGMPRSKPPFPSQKGYKSYPSNINNVETFANVPWILQNGGKAYAELGTESSPGTKVFALAGRVKRGGLVEVPMGIPLEDVVYEICGGLIDDRPIKAIQIGGPSGGCLPKEKLGTQIDYASINQTGAIMGSGGLVVMDEDSCMVDMARFFMDFTSKESCGKCVPCRIGTTAMKEILNKIVKGQGQAEDIEKLKNLGESIKNSALCGLGNSAPNPVLTTLNYFLDEYMAHIEEKRCPALKCTALLHYEILEDKCIGCTLCKRACPTDAISGQVKEPHIIDNAKCINCGSCDQVCRYGAVLVTSGKQEKEGDKHDHY